MNPQPNPALHRRRFFPGLQSPPIAPLAAALLAILLYAVTLAGTYVYDDVQIVRDDPRVHEPHQWIRLWTTDYFDGGIDNLYRPIVSTSYALQWWLHGDRPWIFHAVNILLHALTAAAVAELTRRALAPGSTANTAGLCAGLLFAAHPVHVEAVANIVGRAELLCTGSILFGLILLGLHPVTVGRVIAVIGVGFFALLCKEQGLLQPLLWFFFVLICRRTFSIDSAQRGAIRIFALVTTWLWAAYIIFRERLLRFEWNRADIDPILQPLILSHGADRLLMPVVLLGHYTALLLFPLHLSADYGGDVIGSIAHPTDPYLWIGLATLTIWIAAAFWITASLSRQRKPTAPQQMQSQRGFILFCLVSLAITYGIIGNILMLIATNFAERLIYLPSAFFLMIVGVLLARIPAKPRAVLLAIILICACIRTFTAARDWNHPLALFQHDLINQPKSVQLHLLAAQEYHRHGDIHAANATLEDLCNQYPAYWRAWMFRALEDLDNNNLPDADRSLSRAYHLKADPRLIPIRARLAKLQSRN